MLRLHLSFLRTAMFKGIGRKNALLLADGHGKISIGKNPLQFSDYEWICKLLLSKSHTDTGVTSNHLRSHSYFIHHVHLRARICPFRYDTVLESHVPCSKWHWNMLESHIVAGRCVVCLIRAHEK